MSSSRSQPPRPGNDFIPRYRSDQLWDELLKRTRDNSDTDDTKPPSYRGRRRIVLRHWPRDPKGPFIKTTPTAKRAGNGLELWGATLLDFYTFHRIADNFHSVTYSTGSKLAAWARSVGELDAAEDEIAWADEEEDPVELHPCDISKLVEALETRIRFGFGDPWPLVPFTTSPPPLQQRIPYHLLPKKLIVHDPDGVLFV
ncbi:hypothetical protein BV25DRAFT_1852231, partial [Artomyces pyxidatus]